MPEVSFTKRVKAELARKSFTSPQKKCKIGADITIMRRKDRRAFLRGFFLRCGSMSDPAKSYHLEFVCDDEPQARMIRSLLETFDIRSGLTRRAERHVVYMKDGADIAQLLNVMGAHVSLMEVENLRIYKEMRGTVNRRVNCDAANIAKSVGASGAQTEAILYLKTHGGFRQLPKPLQLAAKARLDAPEATIAELAARMNPPLTKSGMNHRLQKLIALYEQQKKGEP